MPDRLFTGLNVIEVATQCEEAAKRVVAAFTEVELLANSLEELTQAVVADKVPQPIMLDVQNHWIGNEVVQLPERRGATIGTMYRPDIALPAREALKTSLHIPCSGTMQALTYRPSRMPTTSPPEAVVTGLEVVVSVITDPSIAAQVVEQQLLEQEQNLH